MASSTVLVTGGAGYVGSITVPKLLEQGYKVKVLDLFLYGDQVFPGYQDHPNLENIKGDIRDQALVEQSLKGVDHVIHLACISNDPSFELNPDLGKTINYDAFKTLVTESIKAGVQRFVYASSSSVYGIKNESHVTEELSLEPLTDYSKYKALCEDYLFENALDHMTCLIVRPATVCGYAPRQRLDLTVNILTNHARHKGEITVFGGTQLRPNIHIADMSNFYLNSLTWPHEAIHGKVYNVGYENFSIDAIAEMVREELGDNVTIKKVPTDDLRSYHISSDKIAKELNFTPQHTILGAVKDLNNAFQRGLLPDSMNDSRYFNIKKMQEVNLT